MRSIYTYTFLFALFFAVDVNAQQIDWVTPVQSVNDEAGTAVRTDKQGYIYNAGDLGGQITFGAGEPDEVTVTGQNYVARYASDGSFNWVAVIQSDGSPLDINGIDVDHGGNVYIAGSISFGSNYTFGSGEPGETTISTDGNSSDAFIARFDKHGGFEWVRHGGLGEDNGAHSIAVAGNGDSYTTGFFRSHIIFGEEGKTEAVELFSEGGALDNDIFIVKFSKKGDVLWAKSAGGAAGADTGFDISLDTNEDIYLAGHFNDSATFGKDTASEITISSGGSLDGFIVRMTEAGDPVWALPLGGSGVEQARSVAVEEGSAIVVGSFTADFDLSSTDGSTLTIPLVLTDNFFLARYDQDGVLDWGGAIYMDDMPGFNIDVAYGENEQTCVLGNFQGTGIFGIGQDGITVLDAPIDPDMFFACYESNGILQWAASDPARINDGTMGDNGEIVVTGGFEAPADFGPGDPGETTINGDGSQDIFLAQYQNQTPAMAFVTPRRDALNLSDELQTTFDDFRLEGNYPNPFNPETTIRFSLPESAQVSLIVYDALGREVARLLEGVRDAGAHEVVFHARDLPTGLYIYRLTSPAGVETRTMLMTK